MSDKMVRRVLKWPVPVDDSEHPIGTGPVVHVDVQGADPSMVYVWTDELGEPAKRRLVRVFATGESIPINGDHQPIGSVVTASGALVWHVYETGWLYENGTRV